MSPETDWGDPATDRELNADDVERFKASAKKKDLIRIVSKPVKYYSHSLDKSPWYCNCSKLEGRCVLCERGIPRSVKIGCVVVHIADKSADGRGKFEEVGTCKVWLFGKDKWNTLSGIIDDYSKGEAGWLRKQDLIITCTDEQFQKLDIRPTLQKSQATKSMMQNFENARRQLDWYTAPSDLNRQKEALGEGDADDVEDVELANSDMLDDPESGSVPEKEAFSDPEDKKESDPVDDILDEIDSANDQVPFGKDL